MRAFILTCLHGVFLCGFSPDLAAQRSRDPYALQVEEQLKKLGSDSREVRAGAIEERTRTVRAVNLLAR